MPAYKSYGPKRRVKPQFIRPVSSAIVPYRRPLRSSSTQASYGIYRGLRSQLLPHVITKCCNIQMRSAANAGYSWNIGTVASQFFAVWFTQQSIYIWSNASNYSVVSVPGYSDLAALFDEVMIDRIDITLMTGPDPNTGGTGSASLGSAQIILARDYNDKNAPASAGDVQQYADMRILNMSNMYIHNYSVRPKYLTYSLDSAGTSTASTPQRGYLRSNLDTDHYGIKGAFINTSPVDQMHNWCFKIVYKCKVTK